jgi:protein transport protein HofB
MVGEIRDGETAEIAINAAQTGHLVLSTLHTNSTTETLIRLEQMGVARWMISSALSMVIAQRLVRRLCPHCRQETASIQAYPAQYGRDRFRAGSPQAAIAVITVFMAGWPFLKYWPSTTPAAGHCQRGRHRGDRGQRPAGRDDSLFEHGCMAVEQGLTTIEELLRVLGMPDGG